MLINFDIYNVTIIRILLAANNISLIKYVKDMVQLFVYLTINNLSHKIQKLQIKLREIMIGNISIY